MANLETRRLSSCVFRLSSWDFAIFIFSSARPLDNPASLALASKNSSCLLFSSSSEPLIISIVFFSSFNLSLSSSLSFFRRKYSSSFSGSLECCSPITPNADSLALMSNKTLPNFPAAIVCAFSNVSSLNNFWKISRRWEPVCAPNSLISSCLTKVEFLKPT